MVKFNRIRKFNTTALTLMVTATLFSQPLFGMEDKDYTKLLPKVVLIKIFKELDLESLKNTSQVCKDWKRASDEDILWKPFCAQVGFEEVEDVPAKYFVHSCKAIFLKASRII